LQYSNVTEGRFLSRPNRFIAQVTVNGREETVHVKNTGRCRELLIPGCRVYLEESANPARKTRYDLIAVEKQRENGALLVNMDSQVVNAAAEEWLREGNLFPKTALIRREVRYGASRFDFYMEHGGRKAFLEVKGVTLEHDGVASFPDAPTERGIKHIGELISCMEEGYEAYILFVIQMKGIKEFRANDERHAAFGEALRRAKNAGVNIIAMDAVITPDSIIVDSEIPIQL